MNIAVITGASSGIGTEYVRAVNSMYPDVEQIWIIARRENRLIEIYNRELAEFFERFPNFKIILGED